MAQDDFPSIVADIIGEDSCYNVARQTKPVGDIWK